MALTSGPHHLATLTADMDRLWGEVCFDRPPHEARGNGEAASWQYVAYPGRV